MHLAILVTYHHISDFYRYHNFISAITTSLQHITFIGHTDVRLHRIATGH
jgi:hypothetical protein